MFDRHGIKGRLAALFAAPLLAASLLPVPALAAGTVTVDFDANGVAGVVHTEEGEGSVTVPEITLDFEGYEFTGEWNTLPDGSGDAYEAGDEIDESTTVYAQWADGTRLLMPADKTALDEAIAESEALDLSQYTDGTAAALEAALEDARGVSADADAEQPEADAALEALTAAIAALEEKSLPEKVIDTVVDAVTGGDDGDASDGGGSSSASTGTGTGTSGKSGSSSTGTGSSTKSGTSYAETGGSDLSLVASAAALLAAGGGAAAFAAKRRRPEGGEGDE